MGGKTQKRVAGNAKPANSGRIRELLANQQIGFGAQNNLITFSSLSSKKPTTLPKKETGPQEEERDTKLENTTLEPKHDESKDLEQQKPKSPAKENYRLVVRRVANRDLYTRVKITELDGADSNTLQPTLSSSETNVKKPDHLLERVAVENTTNLSEIDDPTKNKEEGQGEEEDVSEGDNSEAESISELDGDFDYLVDRLGPIQEDCASSSDINSLSEMNQVQIENELNLLQLLKTLVKRFSHDLSIEDWDLVTSSLYKWVDWISKSELPLRETFQSRFSVKVFTFIHQLICFSENLRNLKEDNPEFPMMQSILDDWSNFHSSNMFQDLLVLFFRLVALENNSSACQKSVALNNETIHPIIEALAHIMNGVDPKLILSHYSLLDHLSTRVEFDPEWKEPTKSVYCYVDPNKFKSVLAVFTLLRSNNRVILVSAHSMLSKTLNSICTNAIQAIIPTDSQNQEDGVADEDIPVFPPAALMSILTSRDALMSALLSDYRVGDTSVTIEHNTDAYTCTLSYLFVWDLVIQFIVGVDKEIGHKIIHSLKRLGLIQRLLDNIFILLPPLGQQDSLRFRIYKSTQSNKDNYMVASHSSSGTWNLEKFLKSPLRTTVKRPLNEIELISLHLYFSVASHMPVTVRKWYNNNSNKRLCNLVNEYTVKHVSRVICSLEMESVQEKCFERAQSKQETNLTIKARPTAQEVYAIYSRDEFKMELTIKLPTNYPLGPVQIDGGKRVGVTDVKWRSWLLQLTTFLSHQNGPILDGIDLWRRNIDKRFEGVEKCTICFSILHSNYQLPKKKCQTCTNVFHNLCLFKWFESSGNSTCPLCRNPW